MDEPVVVIGYGNELRRDDGLGPRVADAIAGRGWPGVRALALPQLLPELAELLTRCRLAIFVDARCDDSEVAVAVAAILPAVDPFRPHASNPGVLLALARDLYGKAPLSWSVTVAGADFGWGEGLSPAVERLVPEAVRQVEHLVRAAVHMPATPAAPRPRYSGGERL